MKQTLGRCASTYAIVAYDCIFCFEIMLILLWRYNISYSLHVSWLITYFNRFLCKLTWACSLPFGNLSCTFCEFEFKGAHTSICTKCVVVRVWIYLLCIYSSTPLSVRCLTARAEQLEKGKRGWHIAQLSINSLERARRLVISNSHPALASWLRRFCTLQVVHLKLMQRVPRQIEQYMRITKKVCR